jgi:hypothetical protein
MSRFENYRRQLETEYVTIINNSCEKNPEVDLETGRNSLALARFERLTKAPKAPKKSDRFLR